MDDAHNTGTLAIHGGTPVRTDIMPARVAFGDAEVAMLNEAVDYYRTQNMDPPYQGIYEERFCEAFSDFMGGGYTDAVASGTAACFIALAALDLPTGCDVMISPVTDSGPLNCIIMQGYRPVLVDSRPESYNIGLEEFLARITPNTRAIMAVHSAGEPLEIDQLVAEAHRRDILVVEDCSQAPGALCNGDKVGVFGDSAAFSTMYRKSLAAGASGGLVFSRDEKIYHRALGHADRGKPVWRKGVNLNDPGLASFPALNFNTDELSCAIGVASLKRLQATIERRNTFVHKLIELMAPRSRYCRPYSFHGGFSPFYLPIFVDTDALTCTKNEFAEALVAEGIPANIDYGCVISDWEWARDCLSDDFVTTNAVKTRDTSFNLFLNEQYGTQEAEDVVRAIEKLEANFSK
jgi:perosamine synthetase